MNFVHKYTCSNILISLLCFSKKKKKKKISLLFVQLIWSLTFNKFDNNSSLSILCSAGSKAHGKRPMEYVGEEYTNNIFGFSAKGKEDQEDEWNYILSLSISLSLSLSLSHDEIDGQELLFLYAQRSV